MLFRSHFNDERILLFLRNVKTLIFSSPEEKFEISNSSSNWKIFTESNIKIPENETSELNRRINFPDKRIPVKFHDITLTELGFGFRLNKNKVESIGDGFIYAYLPTRVNLGFSFILNGNFIPDASRTKIYSDLTWNSFLFEKAGELFFKQITSLLADGLDKESVLKQIPSFSKILLNIKDDDKINFITCFKKGFEKDIFSQHFIPTQIGILETLSNILIDETGLADLLKEDFLKLTGITGKLIHNELGEGEEKIKALITEYEQGVVYSIEALKADLKSPTEIIRSISAVASSRLILISLTTIVWDMFLFLSSTCSAFRSSICFSDKYKSELRASELNLASSISFTAYLVSSNEGVKLTGLTISRPLELD